MTRLAASRLGRSALETALRGRALRLLAGLDEDLAGRAQERLLRGLVHRARRTPFGRAHDFGRIRTPRDFRRLVPLGLPGDFAAVLPIPRPAHLLASQPRAALTALALVAQARPGARLFAGQILMLSGYEAGGEPASALWRPCVSEWIVPPDGAALAVAADSAGRRPVTCVVGAAGVVGRFLPALRRAAGDRRAAEVWPRLTAVICVETGDDPAPPGLEQEVGDAPVLRLYANAAGLVAVEDRRRRALRLLADHGAFFEFIPKAELHLPEPTRLALGEVELGVDYALAVSSPVGVWACLTGERLCFESVSPPLVHFGQPAALERPVWGPAREAAVPAASVPRARRERVGAR